MGPSYRGYVYLLGSARFGWYKIGKTKNAEIRINDLGILLPFRIEVFAVWKTEDHTALEAYFHKKCLSNHINGEWFSFRPSRLRAIISESHPFSALLTSSPIISSTIKSERIIDGSKEINKARSGAFMKMVYKYLEDNNLENNKENKRIARNYISGNLHEFDLNPKGLSVLESCQNLHQVAARTA